MATDSNRLYLFKDKVFQAVLNGVRRITQPSAKVEPKQRRRIRLLAAFMLIMSVNTLIGTMTMRNIGFDGWVIMLATTIAFILGYFFSRTRHYRIALGMAITVPAVPSLAIAIYQPPETSNMAEFMWLALPLMVASLMLTVRQTIWVALSYFAVIIALKLYGVIEFETMGLVLAYILIIAFIVIAITFIRRKDQTELENQLNERLRIEKTLRESEEKFRSLFEYAKDAIILADVQTGILVDINPAGCRLIGLPKEKIVGRHQSELHPPELADKYKQVFREHVEQGFVVSDDIIIQHADGSHIQCDLSASIIKMGDREVIQGVFRDITERKRMEKALADEAIRRRILVEQSRDGIVILDQNGKVYEANRRFAEMLGYSQEEVMKLDVWDWEYQFPPEQVKEMIRTVTEEGDHFETRHRRKDGSIYDVEISTNGAIFAGQKLIFCVCRDITERKRAEETLREREKRFSDIAENALEWIWEVDAKGKYTYSSPVIEKILGYKPEEVLKKHFYDFFLPEEGEELKKAAFDAFAQKQPFKEFINRNMCKNGKIVVLMTSGVPVLDEKGNLLGYRGVDTDITERIEAEEALKTNEERFRLIADNSTDLISRIQIGPSIRTDYVSPSCFRITGYKQEEFYTDPNLGLEMIHPDDREFFVKIVDPGKKDRQKPIMVRLVRKDGRIVWIEQTHTVIRNERGEPIAIHLIAHDITERQRSEQALKESEAKFSAAFRSSPNTMAITTRKEGIFLEVNDSFTSITGYTREEVIGHSSSEINIWARVKDRARMLQLLKKNGKVDAQEFEFRMKSGEIRTWLFSAEKINIEGESCIISMTADITERKRAEKLQHDENYVLTLLGQGAELHELLDAIVHLGESHDPSIKGSVLLFDPVKGYLMQAAAPSLPADYKKLLENGVPIGPEMGSCGTAAYTKKRVIVEDIANSPLFAQEEVVKGANKNGLYSCWSQPIIASNGDVLGTIANYGDKTGEPDAGDLRVLEWSVHIAAIAIERKRAEEALRESEEKFSIAFRSSPQQVIITRLKDSITLDVNDSFTRVTGFTREETVGHSAEKLNIWVNPGDEERILRLLNEQGHIYNEEFEFRKKSGEKHTELLSAEKVIIGGDECMLSILTDITERKKAEETLRFSDAAFKSIHESVIVTNLEGEITLWNEISEQLFGNKASEVLGKKFLEVIEIVETYPGETQDRIKMIQKHGHWEEERLYRTKKGDIWVDVRLQDIVGNGKRYGRVMLASDITQRKKAEAELKQALVELEQSSARLAATNKELEAFSYSVSHDLRSPLRSIDGFSQALLEDYEDKLNDTGQDYLKRLRGASQKMGELIDGLLKLSRLTRSEMHHETVDLSSLAEEIAGRLQETHPKRRAKFIIEKGLRAKGDPQLLRALLENLLSNAWKFTRNKPEAKIEFSLDHNGDKKSYFIRDNGAGFDMTYSDKLFGAFQRLHDINEFPGTGIGLATVQRIINRHGGTIRAEGAVGKGATFYFTLN